jgi:hypothetical protein
MEASCLTDNPNLSVLSQLVGVDAMQVDARRGTDRETLPRYR